MQVSGSVIAALLGGSNNAGGTLFGTLYGGFAPGATVTGGDPVAALRLAQKNRARAVAAAAKEPETQRDIAAFRRSVDKATTAEDALANPAVMKVLLSANGLADQLPYAALARKVLLSDPADPKSLVNRLADSRWKAVVNTFQFASKGLASLKDPAVQTSLADGYAEVAWRKGLEARTPGLSDALDFRERATQFTSAVQILGDPVLRRVVTSALGIPREIAFQELPAQERAITARLSIDRLQDPKFIDALSQRYLLERQRTASATSQADVTTLGLRTRGLTV